LPKISQRRRPHERHLCLHIIHSQKIIDGVVVDRAWTNNEQRTAVHESHQCGDGQEILRDCGEAKMDGTTMHGFNKIVSFGRVKTS
jgi:hypothetical protein